MSFFSISKNATISLWLDILDTINLTSIATEVRICSAHFNEKSFNKTFALII